MNTAVFPLFDGVFTYARDVSVFANAVFLVAVGLWASFSPGRLRANAANTSAFVLFLIGGILLPVALVLESAALLVVSSCVLAVARGWASLCVGLFLSRLSADRIIPAVVMAFLAYCIVDMALWFVPGFAGGVRVYRLRAGGAGPFSQGVARCHGGGLCGRGSCGYGHHAAVLVFAVGGNVLRLSFPVQNCFWLLPALFRARRGAAAGVCRGGPRCFPCCSGCRVFPWSILARSGNAALGSSRAGRLFVASSFGAASAEVSVGLLSAGNTLFDMVAWSVLAAVAMRNVHGSMAVVAWGRGVSGIGTIVGAAFGVWSTKAFADNEHAAILVAGAFVLFFVGYALIGLKDFSFAGAIEGVVPLVEEPEAKTPEKEFEERCAAIGDRCGLTPREREVFVMLARGRNREYIQEQLVVSRNTVKAHVKHVYAKLGIHTHQELLDMVEGNWL